jgi:RNA methyltransferase, TrmH family
MTATITSPHNEKLKRLRRLAERRGREREGLFATEGEDLLAAGLAAGATPAEVLVAAGSGIAGTEVEPELLDRISSLGSGTRAIALWPLPDAGATPPSDGLCVYLHGVADPANVGAIIRTAGALAGARVALGPGCADPYGPKATRASMGALFAHRPLVATVERTPEPRLALDAHGGGDLDAAIAALSPRTICLGGERHGLDEEVLDRCAGRATIELRPPAASGVESLNVAAAAAIALHRVCSAAVLPLAERAAGDE